MRTPMTSENPRPISFGMQKDAELPEYQSEASATMSTATISPAPSGDSPDQVLWPGSTFLILEKNSKLAITLTGHNLTLTEDNANDDQRWLCVEKDGFFGLYNTKARVYIGHDDRGGMRAVVRNFKDWEYLMPRRHPNGGYQLLSPHKLTMKMVVVADEAQRIMRTDHGNTLWEFQKV